MRTQGIPGYLTIPIAVISTVVGAVTATAARPVIEDIFREDGHTVQAQTITTRPTYEQWLVQEGFAPSKIEMDQLEQTIAKGSCLVRISSNVSYQAGWVDPVQYSRVEERVERRENYLILRQRFPKRSPTTDEYKRGIRFDKAIETRFTDLEGDGIANAYETFLWDTLGSQPLMKATSRFVLINTESRKAYNEGYDPKVTGIGSFELYRQQAFAEALHRFIQSPQNNRPC